MVPDVHAEEIGIVGRVESRIAGVVLGDGEAQAPLVNPQYPVEIAIAQDHCPGNLSGHRRLDNGCGIERVGVWDFIHGRVAPVSDCREAEQNHQGQALECVSHVGNSVSVEVCHSSSI